MPSLYKCYHQILPLLNKGKCPHYTYALEHLSSSKLPADKQIGCQGQKKTMSQNDCQSPCVKNGNHSPCVTNRQLIRVMQKTAIAHHVSQKTTVTPRVTMTTVYTTCHKRQQHTPRVTKDDGTHHVSQKTTVHTTCHKRRRYTPHVTKTTVHTPCHKDDGTHHVSQKTTVHITCYKDEGHTRVTMTTVVRLCHEGQ